MDTAGFLGLGRMGAAIASRLLLSGIGVVAWNRSRSDRVEQLVRSHVTLVGTPAEALAQPVSFSMLADDAAVDEVLSVANIASEGSRRIHVNMASVSAAMADRLASRFAEAGVVYVAAPVLGRPDAAEAGALNVLVAGPDDAVDELDPLLATYSVRRWRIGARPRQANAAKIALNFMLLQALESMGEGIALVEGESIDAREFVTLFSSTFFAGMVHTTYGTLMAERRYMPPGFSMQLGLKDLGLAEQLAASSGIDLATAPAIRQRFEAALADPDLADLDWAAVAEVSRASVRRA